MTTILTTDIRKDGFLGGQLLIAQPLRGYRAGADAVMLAAACPAQAGARVLELGCGAGVASLCLGRRVAGLVLTGLELQAVYADLARRNAAVNAIPLRVIEGDLTDMPAALRAESFDHVIANPPYFQGGTESPDRMRGTARRETAPLAEWIGAGLRRLRPGGRITLIQRADRMADLLHALSGRAGTVRILPVAAREGRDAGRVIVTAIKGGKGMLRLLPPFVMHAAAAHDRDREDLTPAAQAVLRHGAAITLN